MIEKHLDISTADGSMNTFVVRPDGPGPFPAVLFYMDAPGKREELHDMARRLSAGGYYVVLPNLYYRRSRDYWLKERTPEAMAVMFDKVRELLRLRRDRQVGAQEGHRHAGSRAGGGRHAAPHRVGGTRGPSMASCSHFERGFTSPRARRGIGSGCSSCSGGRWGELPLLLRSILI